MSSLRPILRLPCLNRFEFQCHRIFAVLLSEIGQKCSNTRWVPTGVENNDGVRSSVCKSMRHWWEKMYWTESVARRALVISNRPTASEILLGKASTTRPKQNFNPLAKDYFGLELSSSFVLILILWSLSIVRWQLFAFSKAVLIDFNLPKNSRMRVSKGMRLNNFVAIHLFYWLEKCTTADTAFIIL